jgi:hypothetical protein
MEVKVGQMWLWKPTNNLFLVTNITGGYMSINGINLQTKLKTAGLTIIANATGQIGFNWQYINSNENIARILYG